MAKNKKDSNFFQPKKVEQTNKKSTKPKQAIAKKPSSKTPDAWDISAEGKNKKLIFYKQDKVLAELPINPETMNELIAELSNLIIIDDNIATSWTYRTPAGEGMPEFLTLMKEGKILGTLPVDKTVGRKLGKELSKYIAKPNLWQRVNRMRKTKPKSFYFVSFIFAVIAGILMYNIFLNIFGNVGITI